LKIRGTTNFRNVGNYSVTSQTTWILSSYITYIYPDDWGSKFDRNVGTYYQITSYSHHLDSPATHIYKQRKPQFQYVWLTEVLTAQLFQLIASNSTELFTTSAVSPKRQWVCRLCSQIIKATRDVVSTFPFVLFELPFSFQTITHYFPQPLLPMTKVREPNPETGSLIIQINNLMSCRRYHSEARIYGAHAQTLKTRVHFPLG